MALPVFLLASCASSPGPLAVGPVSPHGPGDSFAIPMWEMSYVTGLVLTETERDQLADAYSPLKRISRDEQLFDAFWWQLNYGDVEMSISWLEAEKLIRGGRIRAVRYGPQNAMCMLSRNGILRPVHNIPRDKVIRTLDEVDPAGIFIQRDVDLGVKWKY